jgi:DNA polymerase (family 10)
MALAAKALGRDYLCISDHTGSLRIAGGMSEDQIIKQGLEIAKVNKELSGITVLHGAEVNIEKDGSLDVSNDILKKLDLVLASVHSSFKMSEDEMTERIIKAMSNDYVNIICHPTGGLINERNPYIVNLEKLFAASRQFKTYFEINSYPSRLDLNDINAREAIKAGCKLVINTDAHSTEQLKYLRLGIGVARRAWIESNDILNTLGLKDFMKAIKK